MFDSCQWQANGNRSVIARGDINRVADRNRGQQSPIFHRLKSQFAMKVK
jgi:hypothetical protein